MQNRKLVGYVTPEGKDDIKEISYLDPFDNRKEW